MDMFNSLTANTFLILTDMRIEQWSQLNNGDKQGTLYETRNCSFDKRGVIKLANKTAVFGNDVEGDGGDTGFEQVMGLESFSDDIFVITDGDVFSADLDGTFATSTSAGAIPRGTSSVVCYGILYVVSDTNDVDTYNGSSWTADAITGLNAGSVNNVGHPMCVFDSLPTYKLAIGGTDSDDNGVVRVYNRANSASSTVLTLPENYIVTALAYRNGYLFVGTKTDNGQEAKVFVWDGATANANYSVPMGASYVFALTPYKESVAGITNEGELFAISGSSKMTLGGLPIYYSMNKRWTSSADEVGNVVHKGMTTIGDNIYFSVESNLAGSAFIPGMPDGLWCFDPQIGVHHYASPTTDPVVRDQGLSLSSNELTTSATHNLVTGDAVSFATISGLTGVSTDTLYYAIVTDTNKIKLAVNRHDALLGNAIQITGTPGATDDLVYVQNTDRGTLVDSTAGAVMSTNHRTDIFAENLASDVIFGAEPYSLSDTVESTVQCFADSYNIGWFTTQKIYSSKVTESWHCATVFLNGGLLASEKIIFKYRTEERASMPTRDVAIEWTSSTQFNISDLVARSNLKKGDEVVFLRGRGQGQTAHITNVDISSNTVTAVTVDESYGNTGDSGKVYFTNFKKLQENTSVRTYPGHINFDLSGVKSSWIQIKVEMRGFDIEVAAIDITAAPDK